jgi:hypothetical protein
MGTVGHWMHEHHVLPAFHWHVDLDAVVDFLKAQWVILLLLAMGVVAIITAILIAWPIFSYIGARWFG